MATRSKILFVAGLILLLHIPAKRFKEISKPVNNNYHLEKFYNKINWNDQQGIFAADLIHQTTSLVGEKIIMHPYNYLKLNISGVDFDFTPTETKTIYNDNLILHKQLNIFNPSLNTDTVFIGKDSLGIVTFTLKYSQVTDGPFTVSPDGKRLIVSSHYNGMDVIPIKVIYRKTYIPLDMVEFKWENDYPPYYVSQYYKNRNIITNEDIIDILNSYSNLSGDYFNENPKQLVCTDAVTLVIKTVGIDYPGLLQKYHITGNEYLQRYSLVLYRLLKKLDLTRNFIHYFMDGDVKKIYKYGRYKNLVAQNFGIDKLEPGQVMFYDRYFNSGPKTGKVQRFGIHSGLITDVIHGKIAKAAMVTSRSRKAPYDTLIMLDSDLNFPAWFGYRQHYLGSDETHEDLRYLVYAIMDFKSVLQKLRRINVQNNNIAVK